MLVIRVVVELSVIIVNYNVRYFLAQCLDSVDRALRQVTGGGEIIVVDNHSTDQSISYLMPRYPCVQWIANTENKGFAAACNQGWKAASGKYLLFLNPDTLIPEDGLAGCLAFFAGHPDAGAIGVRMLDGSGRFLRESRRSFPDPVTSFYKLSGLAALFPHSRVFARYHVGHMPLGQDHKTDVLAGAFLMIRRDVMDTVNGFDESYFMYGEDIDLSYRVQQAGFTNYYLANPAVIHFKGESTRKGSLNYVRMFYRAMSVFARKHYGSSKAGVFHFFIQLSIGIRGAMAATGKLIRRVGLPVIDAAIILVSFVVLKEIWSRYVRPDVRYPDTLLLIAFPLFALAYLLVAWYAGLYDRRYRGGRLFRATGIATLFLLAGYSLLPESYRFSRGIVLFGAVLAFVLMSAMRMLLVHWKVLYRDDRDTRRRSIVIAGTESEYQQVLELLARQGRQDNVLGRISVPGEEATAIGHWDDLPRVASLVPFREIVFCTGSLSYKNIISGIRSLGGKKTMRIYGPNSESIIGSDSKDTAGETWARDNTFRLQDPYYRRIKRLADVFLSLFFLVTFPIQLFLVRRPGWFYRQCISVLFAGRTWIGYAGTAEQLPPLRPGVYTPAGVPRAGLEGLPAESRALMDQWYARYFDPVQELVLVWKSARGVPVPSSDN